MRKVTKRKYAVAQRLIAKGMSYAQIKALLKKRYGKGISNEAYYELKRGKQQQKKQYTKRSVPTLTGLLNEIKIVTREIQKLEAKRDRLAERVKAAIDSYIKGR